MFNPKTGCCEWSDFIPKYISDFGLSCVQKKKYIKDKVRINNQEVTTGSNRTALYTMPGGIDTGVRYASLYEHSGLDITEIKAAEQTLKNARSTVEKKIKEEIQNNLKELEEKAAANQATKSTDSESSE